MNYIATKFKKIIIMLLMKILNVSFILVYAIFSKACNTLKSLHLELNNKSRMLLNFIRN